MATHYTAASGTYNHKKYGRVDNSATWTKVWYQMSIYVSVASDGTCTYKITSTNNAGDYTDWPRCQVSVWVEIAGETVVAQSFYKGDGFPRYLNSTKSGTLSKKVTGSSVTIKSKILPASDYAAHSTWWSDSLSTSTLNRGYWNDVSKPSAPSAPTDNYNNTFSASCSAVSDPGNNPVATTIQYKLGDSGSWVDANSRTISNKAHTAEAAADTQTVYVRTKADPTHGDTQYSNSSSKAIKNYVAPAQPAEIPSVSKTKSRFTVKEPWVVSWSKTTQQAQEKNNSSPVAGYRIVMLVKRGGTGGWVSEPFKVKANNSQGWSYLGQNPNNKGNGDTWYSVDTSDLDSMTEITIDPMVQGFVPGDIVKVGIRPYILYGTANPSDGGSLSDNYKLWTSEQSINGTDGVDNKTYTFTEEMTVQNAGVVRVKTGNDKSSFKEGIVWVKVSNTGTKTTDWVEADVVKVKTSSGWKESE